MNLKTSISLFEYMFRLHRWKKKLIKVHCRWKNQFCFTLKWPGWGLLFFLPYSIVGYENNKKYVVVTPKTYPVLPQFKYRETFGSRLLISLQHFDESLMLSVIKSLALRKCFMQLHQYSSDCNQNWFLFVPSKF